MCLLLIEASPPLREKMAADFREAGFEIEAVDDVERGFVPELQSRHDVVLIDVELPDTNWLDLLLEIRREGKGARILLLIPGESVVDRVRGLNLGADDCLPKPFSFEELLARVQVLRRPHRSRSSKIQVEDLVIDTGARRVTLNGIAVRLTRREFQILEYLARRRGETVSRIEIEDHLYGEGHLPLSNAVASAICLLRKKLEALGGNEDLLRTLRGRGYSLGLAEAG